MWVRIRLHSWRAWGDRTYLLFRHSDDKLRLTCYDANLQPVNAFGANGTVTIATPTRNEATRRPSLLVRADEVAVVWHQAGTDTLVFQRFAADTGASARRQPCAFGDGPRDLLPPLYSAQWNALCRAVACNRMAPMPSCVCAL